MLIGAEGVWRSGNEVELFRAGQSFIQNLLMLRRCGIIILATLHAFHALPYSTRRTPPWKSVLGLSLFQDVAPHIMLYKVRLNYGLQVQMSPDTTAVYGPRK